MWKKYFAIHFQGYFDKRFLFAGKKSLLALKEHTSKILLVDDTPKIIHYNTYSHFIDVERWYGDKEDTELIRVLSLIKKKWKLQ